jgi:hypothetical protein
VGAALVKVGAENLKPIAGVSDVRGWEDEPLIVSLNATDPDGEVHAWAARLYSLPRHGDLFQLLGGVRGSRMKEGDNVDDERHRVCVLCVFCACSRVCLVHVLCMSCACLVYVLCMSCTCIMHVLCMYYACIMHVLCILCLLRNVCI